MDYAEIVFTSRMIGKERERRFKEEMICAAFTAWLQGAGPETTFPHFLTHFGLGEEKRSPGKEAKMKAAYLMARIKQLSKNQGRKK